MSTVIINLAPSRYAAQESADIYEMDTWVAEHVEFMVENPYQSRSHLVRSTLHFAGSNNAHNHPVEGKPWVNELQQKAHAFLSPQATVIYSGPREVQAPTIELHIGDIVVVPSMDVVLKVVSGGRNADTQLEILSCPPATVDHSEEIAKRIAARTK